MTQFSSVQSLDRLDRRGKMRGDSAEILFQFFFFFQEALVSSSKMGRDVVHQAFPLPTTASPILRSTLKDSVGEAIMACDMSKPCEFPFLDSFRKRFLWTHKGVDLAPRKISFHTGMLRQS